jgi:hypothetical protein
MTDLTEGRDHEPQTGHFQLKLWSTNVSGFALVVHLDPHDYRDNGSHDDCLCAMPVSGNNVEITRD